MKLTLRLLSFALLLSTLLFALASCGEEEGSCKITIVANGKEIVSSYTYKYVGEATVLDAVKSAAKDSLKETVTELKNDRGTVLSFASLNGLTTNLSEDGKTLSYWGYSVKGVDGNLVAISGEQKIQDGLEITFTYHSINLPKSKDAIPVSVLLQIKDLSGDNTKYKNIEVSKAGLTMQDALNALTTHDDIDDAAHKALLTSVAAAIKDNKTSYAAEDAVWTWSVSLKDKANADKNIDFTSKDELKSGDVITLVITASAPTTDDNTETPNETPEAQA